MRKDAYDSNFRLERKHWWFVGRRRIIDFLGKKYIWGRGEKLRILALGCGTGAELDFLSNYGDVIGLDYSQDAVEYCKRKTNQKVAQGDVTDLDFPDHSFDLVVAFDVLEHIDDDKKAVKEIMRVLTDDGFFYMTVPAFNFLWSYNDEIVHHKRRYTIKDLRKVLRGHSLDTLKLSYFNIVFFPLVFVIRKFNDLFRKKSSLEAGDIKETGSSLNTALAKIFAFEKYLLKYISFPFGVSIIGIFRKKPRKS